MVCILIGSFSSQGQEFRDIRFVLVIEDSKQKWERTLKDFVVSTLPFPSGYSLTRLC